MDLTDKPPSVEAVNTAASGVYETVVTITNDLGLHARPAALVAQTAQRFAARVSLVVAERRVDAKSILDILSLAAGKGTTLAIHGQGEDAEACVTAIADLVRGRFQEEKA